MKTRYLPAFLLFLSCGILQAQNGSADIRRSAETRVAREDARKREEAKKQAAQAQLDKEQKAAAEKKKEAELLEKRLKNAEIQRAQTAAQLRRLRAEMIRKDPELQKKYQAILNLHYELAMELERRKEVRNMIGIISRLDADIASMRKQKAQKK